MLMITVPAHAYGALGSGLYGVAQQVNQRLLQAQAIGLNRRATLGLVQYDLHLLALSFGFDLLQGRLHQFIRVYVAWLRHHRAGEVHQLANDTLHAVQLLANVVECLTLARVQATQSALRLSVRNAEGGAQFMGNTRCKTPNGCGVLSLSELGSYIVFPVMARVDLAFGGENAVQHSIDAFRQVAYFGGPLRLQAVMHIAAGDVCHALAHAVDVTAYRALVP